MKKLIESDCCDWSYDEPINAWLTECGEIHDFVDGGPLENNYSYCPYCGSIVLAVPDNFEEREAVGL